MNMFIAIFAAANFGFAAFWAVRREAVFCAISVAAGAFAVLWLP